MNPTGVAVEAARAPGTPTGELLADTPIDALDAVQAIGPTEVLVRYTNSKDWKVTRVQGVELFVAPDGTEYRRTDASRATAAIHWPDAKWKLGPLYLRPESAERLTRVAERKERRINRRESARRART